MANTIKVKGLKEFQRACAKSQKDVKKGVRDSLRNAGNIVRDEARERFAGIDTRSAAGYRTVVRTRGVAVEQRLGRTTGTRPDYAGLQMRKALLPALEAKAPEVERDLGRMMDKLIDGF